MRRRVKRVERRVKRINNLIETKVIEFINGVTNLQLSDQGVVGGVVYGPVLQLTNIVSGSNINQRVGQSIHVSSVNLKFSCVYGDAWNNIRVMLVALKGDFLSSSPAMTDLLLVPTTDSLNQMNYNYQWPNRSIFRVLYDKVIQVGNFAGLKPQVNKFVKIRVNRKVDYFTNTSSIPRKNALFLFAWSDSGVTPYPEFTYNVRVKFQDA